MKQDCLRGNFSLSILHWLWGNLGVHLGMWNIKNLIFKEEFRSFFSFGACSQKGSFCPTPGWQSSERCQSTLGLLLAPQSSSGFTWRVKHTWFCYMPWCWYHTYWQSSTMAPPGTWGLGAVTWERNVSTVPNCLAGFLTSRILFWNTSIHDDLLSIHVHFLVKYHLSNRKQKPEYISELNFISGACF